MKCSFVFLVNTIFDPLYSDCVYNSLKTSGSHQIIYIYLIKWNWYYLCEFSYWIFFTDTRNSVGSSSISPHVPSLFDGQCDFTILSSINSSITCSLYISIVICHSCRHYIKNIVNNSVFDVTIDIHMYIINGFPIFCYREPYMNHCSSKSHASIHLCNDKKQKDNPVDTPTDITFCLCMVLKAKCSTVCVIPVYV